VAVTRVVACIAGSLCIALLAAPSWAGQAGTHAETAHADTRRIDPAQSQVGFTLKTRWGQTLEGRFPVYEGEISALDDGRRRVRLTLSAREVEIVDHRNYTRLTRGKGFFDAERYPEVVFVSEPYGDELTRDGGALAGALSIRGVRRHEVFTIEPSACAHPARDCAVIASGTVQRSDYGVDRWSFALAEEVRFSLQIWTQRNGVEHDNGRDGESRPDEKHDNVKYDNGKP
jgi:polyisoprenoid-binding protein YceI